MTIAEMAAALRGRRLSSVEAVQDAVRAARRLQPRLNAFLTLTQEAALAQAAARDRELAEGRDRGPLHGVPIAHKDCLFTQGVRTTWGSKLFADFVPDRDAEVVRRLEQAGAVSIGKTNLHELTYGMTSNNPHYGPVRNPWDPERIAGGSSGGSAVAVAAGVVPLATGTDTGGSIRIPAAFCGVVGFKPTYDRVSRAGCFPLGLTMDHVGPITATVQDAAEAFRAMAGDAAPLPEARLTGLRIGLPVELFERVDGQVGDAVHRAARAAAAAGAQVRQVRVGDVPELNRLGRVIQLAEAAAVLERHAGRRADFGPDVLALLDQGRLLPATAYLNAQRSRRELAGEFARVWRQCDFLLAPATPMTAPLLGQTAVRIAGQEEDIRLAGTRLTRPFNLLGWPALAIPCGFSAEGLPIGLQLIAPPRSDERLLALGAAIGREITADSTSISAPFPGTSYINPA
jgi:aspartyl-tRNA(Asn)/glutamyl-tRNA(Gln) amidotransferase subunit A